MVTWIWDVPAGDHRLILPPHLTNKKRKKGKERERAGERERGEREGRERGEPSYPLSG